MRKLISLGVALASALAVAGSVPASAESSAGAGFVEITLPDIATMDPGDQAVSHVFANGAHRGSVYMTAHVGNYWVLEVCDAISTDEVALAGRIDPNDGRILSYYDLDENNATCFKRDIHYYVRKFRAAWGDVGGEWKAPPPR